MVCRLARWGRGGALIPQPSSLWSLVWGCTQLCVVTAFLDVHSQFDQIVESSELMGAQGILQGVGQADAEICHNETNAWRIGEVIDQVLEAFVEFLNFVGGLHLELLDGSIKLFLGVLPSIPLTEGGVKCGLACGRVRE